MQPFGRGRGGGGAYPNNNNFNHNNNKQQPANQPQQQGAGRGRGKKQQFGPSKQVVQQKGTQPVARGFKNYLDNPFNYDWEPLSQAVTEQICSLLGRQYFAESNKAEKKKRTDKDFRGDKKRHKAEVQRLAQAGSVPLTESTKARKKRLKELAKQKERGMTVEENLDMDVDAPVEKQPQPATNASAKPAKVLPVLGVNAVTRAMERQELSLVLVAWGAKALVAHVPALCAAGRVRLGVLEETSQNLGKLFGLQSVVAIGFKKDIDYGPLVGYLEVFCFEITMPWIKQAQLAMAIDTTRAAATNNNSNALAIPNSPRSLRGSEMQPAALEEFAMLPLRFHLVNHAKPDCKWQSRGRPHLPKFKKQKIQTWKGVNK